MMLYYCPDLQLIEVLQLVVEVGGFCDIFTLMLYYSPNIWHCPKSDIWLFYTVTSDYLNKHELSSICH